MLLHCGLNSSLNFPKQKPFFIHGSVSIICWLYWHLFAKVCRLMWVNDLFNTGSPIWPLTFDKMKIVQICIHLFSMNCCFLTCQEASCVLFSTQIMLVALSSIQLITTSLFLAWQISCCVGIRDVHQSQYDDTCTKTGLDRSLLIHYIIFRVFAKEMWLLV